MKSDQMQDDYPQLDGISPEMQRHLVELLKHGRDFDHQQIDAANRSERKAWISFFVSMALNVLGVIGLIMLLPLKTVEDHIISVDLDKGIAQLVNIKDWHRPSMGQVMDGNLARQYVQAREGYIHVFRREQNKTVQLLSAGHALDDWKAYFDDSNWQSPQWVYRNKVVKIEIRSDSPGIDSSKWQVRFRKIITTQGKEPVVETYIATLKYRYVKPPEDRDDVAINPTGFQVTDYVVTPDSSDNQEHKQ